MTLIECPFCGPRELEEYHFLRVLPPPDVSPEHDSFAAVYQRDNLLDRSAEYWQHRGGCQAWLLIERNPSTAEVLNIRMLLGDRR